MPKTFWGETAMHSWADLFHRNGKSPSGTLPAARDVAAFVNNYIQSRMSLIQSLSDSRRDIDDECGYPKDPVDPLLYRELYDREAVAKRVVEVMPRESWQVTPRVYEVEDGTVKTEFERKLRDFFREQAGEENYHVGEDGSLLWGKLKQADVDCGIGHYSVLVIGLNDSPDLSVPARSSTSNKVLWIQSVPEWAARVTKLEDDLSSPRFGLPLSYAITFNDPRQSVGLVATTGVAVSEQEVHWTRVVHVSEGGVFGIPRMRPVLNRLLDLRKLYGGSAEMYWRGAFPGISVESDPKLGGDVMFDPDDLRDNIEAYFNGLQRYLALNGFTAKSLAPQVVDPTPQINVQVEAICIEIGVPVRVFKGSERGQLASSQDDAAWNDRLKERQNNFTTPRIIRPFFNRLISLGVLPVPDKGYQVWWPDLTSQTDEEKSSVALKLMQSLAQYVSSGGDAVLTPFDFFTTVWRLPEPVAQTLVDRAEKALEEAGGVSPLAQTKPAAPAPNRVSQLPEGSPSPSKPASPGKQTTSPSRNGD